MSLLTDLVTHVMRPIFVSRDDPNSRQRAAEEIRQRVEAGTWPSVLIFPEGTEMYANGVCFCYIIIFTAIAIQ